MKTITKYFEDDHDRLDDLFNNFQASKTTDFVKAKAFFAEFITGLKRHILWEEEILFPLFEEKRALSSGGPTAMMRLEHRRIAEWLDAIHNKVKVADPNSDAEEQRLLAILSLHNMKEENILYPAIDHSLSPADVEKVFEQMKQIPEEHYARCCADAPALK